MSRIYQNQAAKTKLKRLKKGSGSTPTFAFFFFFFFFFFFKFKNVKILKFSAKFPSGLHVPDFTNTNSNFLKICLMSYVKNYFNRKSVGVQP